MSGSAALTGQETTTLGLPAGGIVTVTLNQIAAVVALQVAINLPSVVEQVVALITASSGAGIDLSAATVTPGNAGTKQTLATFIGGFLPVAGGTMDGELTLAQLPVLAMDAATKGYVDNAVARAIQAPSAATFLAQLQAAVAAGAITLNGNVLEYSPS